MGRELRRRRGGRRGRHRAQRAGRTGDLHVRPRQPQPHGRRAGRARSRGRGALADGGHHHVEGPRGRGDELPALQRSRRRPGSCGRTGHRRFLPSARAQRQRVGCRPCGKVSAPGGPCLPPPDGSGCAPGQGTVERPTAGGRDRPGRQGHSRHRGPGSRRPGLALPRSRRAGTRTDLEGQAPGAFAVGPHGPQRHRPHLRVRLRRRTRGHHGHETRQGRRMVRYRGQGLERRLLPVRSGGVRPGNRQS
ncbi:hypothetical protein D9M72_498700 [compost metagenome]